MVSTTIITPAGTANVEAEWADGAASVDVAQLEAAIGWELNDSGLCRGDVCVPNRSGLGESGRVDLAEVAAALDAPFITDDEVGSVVLGEQRSQRALALQNAQLPPFELPDLSGTPVPSSTWANKKKVLVVWASW